MLFVLLGITLSIGDLSSSFCHGQSDFAECGQLAVGLSTETNSVEALGSAFGVRKA